MQPESRKYLAKKGIDYFDFVPKIINRGLLKKQDLILTMEKRHAIEVVNTFNDLENLEEKTFTLLEFNGDTINTDIIDPYYTSGDTYKKVLKIIDQNVEKALYNIIETNKNLEN